VGAPYSGSTDLFIQPGFNFKMVTLLQTNFHLPSSSLMMLVDAFLDYKKAPKSILELYEYAIKEKFRFFSFGDTMLII
jgi:S-adenosylmethionine:tRNA ribosyltransferase-isomerase